MPLLRSNKREHVTSSASGNSPVAEKRQKLALVYAKIRSMGDRDSSLTRVQPVFNALLDRWPDGEPWVGELWDLAVSTHPGALRRQDIGRLLESETPNDHD